MDIYSKNIDLQFNQASMTKMVTCCCVAKQVELGNWSYDDVWTLPSVSGTFVTTGAKFKISELLHGFIIASWNSVGGVVAHFLQQNDPSKSGLQHINDYAQSIGMSNTTIIDPSGNSTSTSQRSNVVDFIKLYKHIEEKYPYLMEIMAKPSHVVLREDGGTFAIDHTVHSHVVIPSGLTLHAKSGAVGLFESVGGVIAGAGKPKFFVIANDERDGKRYVDLQTLLNDLSGEVA